MNIQRGKLFPDYVDLRFGSFYQEAVGLSRGLRMRLVPKLPNLKVVVCCGHSFCHLMYRYREI